MTSVSVVHMVSSLEVGGAERFAIDLSVLQLSQKSDAKILSFGHDEEPLVHAARAEGVLVETAADTLPALFRQLKKYKKPGVVTVFHIHSPAIVRRLASLIPLLSFFGIRFIYTRHGCRSLDDRVWKLIHVFVRPFIDAVTFVSIEGLEIFHRVQGWSRNKLHWIQNGVVIAPGKDVSDESRPVCLAMVGRMVELKAQIHLLQAAKILLHDGLQNFEVHFFGDGPERASLEAFTQGNGLSSIVTFHGMVMDRSLMKEHMDVLVMCSETEGLSLAIMEAMASGVPVISTDVGDSGKLVLPGKTGELYDFGDIERLVALLKLYLSNRELIAVRGNSAKQHMQDNYSLDKTNQQYMALYLG